MAAAVVRREKFDSSNPLAVCQLFAVVFMIVNIGLLFYYVLTVPSNHPYFSRMTALFIINAFSSMSAVLGIHTRRPLLLLPLDTTFMLISVFLTVYVYLFAYGLLTADTFLISDLTSNFTNLFVRRHIDVVFKNPAAYCSAMVFVLMLSAFTFSLMSYTLIRTTIYFVQFGRPLCHLFPVPERLPTTPTWWSGCGKSTRGDRETPDSCRKSFRWSQVDSPPLYTCTAVNSLYRPPPTQLPPPVYRPTSTGSGRPYNRSQSRVSSHHYHSIPVERAPTMRPTPRYASVLPASQRYGVADPYANERFLVD